MAGADEVTGAEPGRDVLRAPARRVLALRQSADRAEASARPSGQRASSAPAAAERLRASMLADVTDAAGCLALLAKVGTPEERCELLATLLEARPALAAAGRRAALCELLSQADVDGALLCAARQGRASATAALLLLGATTEAEDSCGATALVLAAVGGHTRAVAALIAAGANLDAGDCNGYTALMWAAFKGREEVGKMLTDAGADLNRASREGNTALLYAAYSGSLALVAHLLACGATPARPNLCGATAASVAMERGHMDVADIILQHSAADEAL